MLQRFLPQYRSGPYALNPVIPDIDAFEGQVCNYLEDIAARRVRERVMSTVVNPSSYGIAWVALLLAVLASGAQFSVVRAIQKTTPVQGFGTYYPYNCLLVFISACADYNSAQIFPMFTSSKLINPSE